MIFALAFSLIACGEPECEIHHDKNDDGKCDVCETAFTDGCHTKACLDTDNDGKCDNEGCDKATENKSAEVCTSHVDANDNGACDVCATPFNDGCNGAHRDADDNGKCDLGREPFADGCDTKDCYDSDKDGKCDNEGCDKATENNPDTVCQHVDADDNGKCDKCSNSFADGCDVTDCLDTDYDGKCDNDGCDKATDNVPCRHRDADDNGKCEKCGATFYDGCDTKDCLDTDNDGKCDNENCDKDTENKPCEHRDADDNGKCDKCDEAYTDGCDVHVDKNDDLVCDTAGCGKSFSDGCDVHVDKNDDYKCDNAGCNAGCDDGVDDGTYRVVEDYLPEELSEIVYREFENKSGVFVRMHQNSAPFAYFDYETITNCRILSITIPVLVAKDADANGDFIFTIHEVNNTFAGLSRTPIKSYKLKINKDEYGITPGDTQVYKLVTIDLSSYGIVLTETESLAFGAASDTIIPAYLHRDQGAVYAASKAYDQYFEQGVGVLKKIGSGFKVDTPTLCFDLKIERKYASEAEYNAMLENEARYEREMNDLIAQLKEIYKGKKVSVLGDSISTFEGLSDNVNINSSLKDHKSDYYPSYDETVDEYTETYWGRLIADLGMTLCVDNGWSGTHVVGSGSRNHVDSAPERANQLHRNDGTKPDVIIFYMGTNDMDSHRKSSGQMPFGSLYNKLIVNNGKSDHEKVAEWWQGVYNTYVNSGEKAVFNSTYSDFEQAYALALYLMQKNYPGVEIICMNMIQNHYSGLTASVTAKFNRAINAIAEYFGATLVDQSSSYAELTHANNFLYSASIDDVAVHPNVTGHYMMERLILKTLAEKHGIAVPTK